MKSFNLKFLRRKASLLFIPFYFLTRIATAASVSNPSISGTGVDQYGAYVQFSIDIRDQSGSHSAGNLQEVTTGNISYGGYMIASFSASSSSWDDQGINVQILSGYGIAGNGSGWTGMMTSGTGNVVVTNGSGGEATLTLRWYIPQNYLGQSLGFSSHEYVTGYYVTIGGSDDGALGDQGNQNWSGSATANFSIPNPAFSFAPSGTVGNMTISYAYGTGGANGLIGDASGDYTVKHWITNSGGTTIGSLVTDNTNQNATGSMDVGMANSSQSYSFNTSATGQGGYLTYTVATPVTVPPYIWPTSLQAVYNNRDSMQISWNVPVPPGGSGFVQGDDFELQRSTDPTFATNAKSVATYAYDATKSSYSVYDNLTDLTGGSTVYYRLRRTKTQSSWNWNESVNTQVSIAMNTTQAADTAVLTVANNSPQAVITWQPFQGVWTQGTTFTLIKFNNTTSAQAATISLTENQARSGQYLDQAISYCNQFTYSIQVNMGGGYTSPPTVLVPGSVLAVNIGTISNLTASKGYFPDRVQLQWNSQGQFDNYIVERKVYGDTTSGFVQIATVSGASISTIQTTDAQGQPGVYYQYMVVGAVNCNNQTRYSRDTLYAIGFRSPTGNIYGRVTYANGQAVQNVSVSLQNVDNPQLGTSVHLTGDPSSYLVVDSLSRNFTDSAFTLEAWIRPDDAAPNNEVIFSRGGQYELGFNASGQLYFTYNGTTVTGTYSNPAQGYVHVAGIHGGNLLSLMLNDSVIASIPVTFSASSPAQAVYIGRNAAGNNYKGYIDEMRVWDIARAPQDIALNYTRLLTGGEPGLAAYWRFDETITNQFYDISYQSQNSVYNQNDGVMNPAYVPHSNIIPTPAQLALKAYTDSSGNYMISGIPYTGNGTTYTILPTYQTHQFTPTSVNRFISATSSTFSVDFTDNSSFPVTGYVYYFNSTVPVPGVQFLIDGKYAQASNGSLLQTDATGKFSISVPVGYHEVKAVMSNHVFEYGGKITDPSGNQLNYQAAVGPVTLYDSTTIRFIGRVAGGAIQAAYPLGHSLSDNNLGAQLSITMDLPSGTKYNLYAGSNPDSVVTVDHLLPADQKDSSGIHKTRVVYYPNKIVIYPDSITGEFAADLIPVQFTAESASATGWGNILASPVSMDFTNSFIPQYSVYSFVDSSQGGGGAWTYHHYTDSVMYNAFYKFIKRVTPSVSVVQLNASGQELNYFGDTSFIYQTLASGTQNIPLLNAGATGQQQYLLGYPSFTQNNQYQFKIKAFEQYPFYSGVQPNGAPIPALVNGQAVVDNVPTTDGVVSVYDNISNAAIQPDTLSLNSSGLGYYQFTAGDPVTIAPGTKNFSVSVKFGQATNVNWNWLGNPQLQAYVMGGKLFGTDFVTAGPNKILMVLRDPPGSNSYSYVQSGSSVSSSSSYTGTLDNTGDLNLVTKVGTALVTFTGIGVGTINSAVATSGLTVGVHHEEHFSGTNTKTSTTTFTTQFQTSSDPGFVGAPADLYVGYSTNITYGISNNLVVVPRTDLRATDVLIYGDSTINPYLVVNRQGLSFGQAFGTLFAYPQVYILNTLIPHLVNIRNTELLPSSTSPAAGQQAANTGNTPVYVSKLASSDPNFGKSNDDTTAFGQKARTDPFGNGESYTIYFPQSSSYRTDTIMILNQYMQDWKNQIATNERAKLNATLIQNYSFHAGSPVDYSMTTDYNRDTAYSFNFVIGANVINSIDTKFNGAGAEYSINETATTSQGGTFNSSTDTTTTMGFELASGGGSEYLSVDVDKASDGGFSFKTKGGATGCPYEPASTTQFYQPGTVIDQPTVQIEVPKISVDNPVVNNVPSTQAASYTLHLTNASQVQTTATFSLYYANTDSVQGATISVDGASIANGRTYYIPAGQTINVVLTLAKGPKAMNYNNIPIILQSACDTTVYDQVLISAHFVPSCSNVNVQSPDNNWVLNTQSPVDLQGNPYLPVTLNNFDETNSLFDHIELQYKPSQNSQWITSMSFYPDSASYLAAQGQKALITNAQGINYNLSMNNATFNDGPYDIRALAVCQLSPGSYISTPSNVASGVKDLSPPTLFGSPQPANGILGIGDNIQLNFNKPVAAGLLTPTDFQVTGIRNGAPSDHSVSINLDGKSDYAVSEFTKNLSGRSFTAEMWVLPDSLENGTVFSQGNTNSSVELAFTSDNHLQAIVGATTVKSPAPLNFLPGQWSHVAIEYNAADSTVSAFYNFQEVINAAKVSSSYNGTGSFELGGSVSQPGGNYFAGKMQNVRVWTEDVTAANLQINSLTRLSGSENALLSYYPMDEGNGNILFDKAHGNNMQFTGSWSTPPGKAVTLNGNGYVQINTGSIPILQNMDYTLGLWFKGQPGQANAALLSNGKGDGTDGAGSKNLFFLGFQNGLLTFENNGFPVQLDSNYLDNKWHHVAVAVNRISGIGQIYVDGTMQKYFNVQNLGGIAAPYAYAGARVWYDSVNAVTPHIDQYFSGEIDEVRIWNSYLDQSVLDNQYNVRLNGDELGLMAYYPFDNYIQFQGQPYLNFTWSDMVSDSVYLSPDAVAVNAVQTDQSAPIKNRGPVSNLNFNFVVNNNSLIINLLEPPQAVDKTIVTFKVKGVQDQYGNTTASPAIWTAYIDQNPLKWSDDQLNLTMKVDTPFQFTSYITNSSGSNQNFRLDNLPGWLSASPSSGTIPPTGKQQVTFTVNQGINVGSYNDIIEMINDINETQGLSLNLTVQGQAPSWSVNPADFKYNMTVFGKIREEGIFSNNPGDMLAAFMNGKCVGVAHNTYFANTGLWYAFLTVYSDSLQYNNLEFRIWDASNGKIYEGVPSIPVSFVNDTIIGTPISPVIFDGKEMLFNNLQLNQGWSWISFNLYSPNLFNINAYLQNGSWQPGDIIKNNDLGFDQYSVNAGWVGYLNGLNNVSMFMLQAAQAQTLSVNGTAVDVRTTGIPLKGHRWNYISYLPQRNLTVKEALAGYNASDGDVIKSQTGFDMYASQQGWVGNLTYLQPGQGYMLYRGALTDTTFFYPYLPGVLGVDIVTDSLPGNQLIAGGAAGYNPNGNETPVPGNFRYAGNMTMVAVTGNEFALQPGDQVQAYAGNELTGEAKAISNPLIRGTSFFLNIAGDGLQQVSFKVIRNGEVRAVASTTVDYRNNLHIGSLSKPYMLHFLPVLKGITVFPNPFSEKVNIYMNLQEGQTLSATHTVQLSVYDVSGRMIYNTTPVPVFGNTYQTEWDGKENNGAACMTGIYFINVSIDGVPHSYKVFKY